MEKASRIMYSIANIFNWIAALIAIAGIVLSSLAIAGVLPAEMNQDGLIGVGLLVYCIIILIVCLIIIAMVRRAKSQNSSKAWDVLFIILGVFSGNLFYILGGIFGLIAVRR